MVGLILLARHGTHDEVGVKLSGRSEIALNQPGRAEAEALAARLAGTPIASIHSSPRRRARETAAPLARALGLEVRIAPALDEIDFGVFTGRRFDALDGDEDWIRWNSERASVRCPSGETMREAVERAVNYLASLPESDMPGVCVSHCDVIRGVVARQLGMPFDSIFRFDCDPASLTTFTSDGGGLRLKTLNDRVG